jgi:hypothetical protein
MTGVTDGSDCNHRLWEGNWLTSKLGMCDFSDILPTEETKESPGSLSSDGLLNNVGASVAYGSVRQPEP